MQANHSKLDAKVLNIAKENNQGLKQNYVMEGGEGRGVVTKGGREGG